MRISGSKGRDKRPGFNTRAPDATAAREALPIIARRITIAGGRPGDRELYKERDLAERFFRNGEAKCQQA
tara:strand:+ start:599 stop:808 length:210 start_codon:yes stop_codon:yes gene_type:complete